MIFILCLTLQVSQIKAIVSFFKKNFMPKSTSQKKFRIPSFSNPPRYPVLPLTDTWHNNLWVLLTEFYKAFVAYDVIWIQ